MQAQKARKSPRAPKNFIPSHRLFTKTGPARFLPAGKSAAGILLRGSAFPEPERIETENGASFFLCEVPLRAPPQTGGLRGFGAGKRNLKIEVSFSSGLQYNIK
jgi:hypothetical protein